jgi:hypothetical protein
MIKSIIPPAASALLMAIFLSAAACGGGDQAPAPSGTPEDVWQALRARPMRLPGLSPGGVCPVASGGQVSPDFGPALGDGPVYPVGLGTDGVLHFGYDGGFAGSEWGGQKVLWVSSPAYQGPALVRGAQLDGPNELRFEGASAAERDLRLWPEGNAAQPWPPSPSPSPGWTYAYGWRERPSYTRVRAGGCYAYQVDGPGLSEVIVFRAEQAP